MKEQHGIVLGGTLIVDWIKTVDCYPGEGTLANILHSERSIGGSAANNSINLKTLDPHLPVAVTGSVGNDENGRYILDTLENRRIDISGIGISPLLPTSYTDVISVKNSGQRTFFHAQAANGAWSFTDIPFAAYAGYSIVQIGYILLLDAMDREDPEYGTVLARVFAEFQKLGLKTAVDVVSEASDRFTRLVTPALCYVDYLILNELEAGYTVGITLRRDDGTLEASRLRETAERLLDAGHSRLVVIHMPEGGYALTREGEEIKVPSFALPPEVIQGAVGAGDAFCSGVLYGLEQRWDLQEALQLGSTLAACSLFWPDSTGGALSLEAARKKMSGYELRPMMF
ncbi:ribokinase [candidate division KSB3 bacterium]|uniref:Ribokinase n=1 Tax=candidate division KSB3 bacterium TaxID=2044937 RepID=A0A2G6E4X8_9BACT|nr:MAG: ribokinase [candidate division KSB3 bacterium]PIE29492.1 MAG: ribokinase [candidate division KSB3 bacterium]